MNKFKIKTTFVVFQRQIRQIRASTAFQADKGRYPYYNIHKPCTDPEQAADPQYFEKEAMKVDFGPDYLEKLAEIWYTKMSTLKQVTFKGDDFLIKHDSNYWLPELSKTDLTLKYQNVDALKNAPEIVRKMFTIEFGERSDMTSAWKKVFMDSFRTHKLDDGLSLASKIAKKTADIRQWTMLLESMKRKPGWLRQMIFLGINKRRKMLRMLRAQDEETFERILKELKIAYHVPPPPEELPRYTRKGWIEFITRKKCEILKDDKLRRYHAKLKMQQESFEIKRDETKKKLLQEKEDLRRDILALRTEDDVVLDVAGRYPLDTISEVSENLMNKYFYLQADMKKKYANKIFDD